MNRRFLKRKSRKFAVLSIIHSLELIRNMELEYCLSILDTITNEDRYIESNYAVYVLDDVDESLRCIYDIEKLIIQAD